MGASARDQISRRMIYMAMVAAALASCLTLLQRGWSHRGGVWGGSGLFLVFNAEQISFGKNAPPLCIDWCLDAHSDGSCFVVDAYQRGAWWAVSLSLIWLWFAAVLVAGGLCGLIYMRLISRAVFSSIDRGQCRECGYNRRNLPAGAPCPECWAAELCGACQYDRSGLPSEARCPECGAQPGPAGDADSAPTP
jgi:hypothetical protein